MLAGRAHGADPRPPGLGGSRDPGDRRVPGPRPSTARASSSRDPRDRRIPAPDPQPPGPAAPGTLGTEVCPAPSGLPGAPHMGTWEPPVTHGPGGLEAALRGKCSGGRRRGAGESESLLQTLSLTCISGGRDNARCHYR